MTLSARGYKTKKELKAAIGQTLNYTETGVLGPEYNPNGRLCVVGPTPQQRTWFATVIMENGLIKSVE